MPANARTVALFETAIQLAGETGDAHAECRARGARLDGQAEATLKHALQAADDIRCPAWKLRAARDLCLLLRDHRALAEARQILAPAYGQFTDGFDSGDLRNSRELLAQLEQMDPGRASSGRAGLTQLACSRTAEAFGVTQTSLQVQEPAIVAEVRHLVALRRHITQAELARRGSLASPAKRRGSWMPRKAGVKTPFQR